MNGRWEVIRHADGSVGVLVVPYLPWTCTVPSSVVRLTRWAERAGELELADALVAEAVRMIERGVIELDDGGL
ncbi:hypothetical protein FK529_04925 [Tsukamurella asaccharolytica]|uniref:Uncharacterized protein n=1 Tax=Tsukamurella asaccharolytica TaxID=2592067 RepID=A0A5C5RCW6_9ACTN|nr:hypothetical protein [Tsukamurella asaccharolytica]TWS20686.1 hypothetical protein FK529_04925 [Tsukamurella asaccharolytica]